MSHAMRAAVYQSCENDLALDDLDGLDGFDQEEPTLTEAPLFLDGYSRDVPPELFNWRGEGTDTLVFLYPEDAHPGQGIPAYDLGGEG
jgi:hypothetical protein